MLAGGFKDLESGSYTRVTIKTRKDRSEGQPSMTNLLVKLRVNKVKVKVNLAPNACLMQSI